MEIYMQAQVNHYMYLARLYLCELLLTLHDSAPVSYRKWVNLTVHCTNISLSKVNLPHATRALQSHDLSGEGIKLWITYILFWRHKDMDGLPGWVISPMPGPPPRQHKHERQYTPSTHSVIPTRRIWNDDDGQMIFGDLGGLKFPDICLTDEEKPRITLTQETCPDRGPNQGPLRDKRACYHLLHSGGLYKHFKHNKLSCRMTQKRDLIFLRFLCFAQWLRIRCVSCQLLANEILL